MISTVMCSESGCIYQNDGICTLGTVKSPIKRDCRNKECLYYCNKNLINSENLKQASSISKFEWCKG